MKISAFINRSPWMAVLLLPMVFFWMGCDAIQSILTPTDMSPAEKPHVTVMTRNLYLGGDFTPIITAGSPDQIPILTAQFFAAIVASNFPERAQKIADEMATFKPDLVGLQEVSLYRTQTPSDFLLGNIAPNATEVQLDFLAILLAALESRGLHYQVVDESINLDAELPAATSPTAFFDVRMTNRNVILAREGVEITNSISKNYAATLNFSVAGVEVPNVRSYSIVDATVNGMTFTFVNTHLQNEVAPPIQVAQAQELMATLAEVSHPIILVGDFNSAADGSSTETYSLLTSQFTDAYAEGGELPGNTCCHDADLRNAASNLTKRIDLILYHGAISVDAATTVGDSIASRTASGLWPSDHAGVVATMRIKS
ncbi:MAG: endonuclease/exonuclease/phosphatase family protein [Candidatus Poribacteria bacterium]|nr:endonuclease/exonuclease/phosphatase family protein [Candidatus Poribacteria bacterium]